MSESNAVLHYKCSNGHKWPVVPGAPDNGVKVFYTEWPNVVDFFCVRCIASSLRLLCGTVEVVDDQGKIIHKLASHPGISRQLLEYGKMNPHQANEKIDEPAVVKLAKESTDEKAGPEH